MEEKLKKINDLTNDILNDLKRQKLYRKSFINISNSEKTFDLGVFQGSKSTAFSIAKKLISLGLFIEEVSSITELSSFEIKNFINFD